MARGRAKRPKRAVIAETPRPVKRPTWYGPTPHEGQAISWRFSAADREGPFAWSAVPPERMREIIAKLADFETMDHGALRQCRHPHNLPGGIVDEAWLRLVTLGRDDLERVFSFHLGGTERIWCADYKGEGVMFVLWWDPEHRIYPVRKRHT